MRTSPYLHAPHWKFYRAKLLEFLSRYRYFWVDFILFDRFIVSKFSDLDKKTHNHFRDIHQPMLKIFVPTYLGSISKHFLWLPFPKTKKCVKIAADAEPWPIRRTSFGREWPRNSPRTASCSCHWCRSASQCGAILSCRARLCCSRPKTPCFEDPQLRQQSLAASSPTAKPKLITEELPLIGC